MLICSKCGYSERVDWPKILLIVSFILLYAAWIRTDFVPKHELRFYGLAAFLVFDIGLMLSAYRGLRHGRRHMKLAAELEKSR